MDISNSVEQTKNLNEDIIKNLMSAYENRVKNLADIRNLSLELKYAIEDYDDNDNNSEKDEINQILDMREIKFKNNNECNVTINHYKTKLSEKLMKIISKIEKSENSKGLDELFENYTFLSDINKIIIAEKEIIDNIKVLDKENNENIIRIMSYVKKKLDNIKNNRAIMEKFVDNEREVKTGSLLNKKK